MTAWSDPGAIPQTLVPRSAHDHFPFEHLSPPGAALEARELVAVIDEDARTAATLGSLLRDAGLRVLTYTRAEDAAAALRRSDVDLLVVAHPSPLLDELWLAARDARARHRPRVVLLADDPLGLDVRARALADVVGRRGCPAELFDAIHRARGSVPLGRRRREPALFH